MTGMAKEADQRYFENPFQPPSVRLGVVCGLLVFGTVLLPWGVADDRLLWSFDYFNHFYTLIFKLMLSTVWCWGLLVACFAALKVSGLIRGTVFASMGIVLLFFLYVSKANPIAWTAFSPIDKTGNVIHWLLFLALLFFIIVTKLRTHRTPTTQMSVLLSLTSVFILTLSAYGVWAVVSALRDVGSVLLIFNFATLALSAAGATLVMLDLLSKAKPLDRTNRRMVVARYLIIGAIVTPVIGRLTQPFFNGEQFSIVFASLNTYIVDPLVKTSDSE